MDKITPTTEATIACIAAEVKFPNEPVTDWNNIVKPLVSAFVSINKKKHPVSSEIRQKVLELRRSLSLSMVAERTGLPLAEV